MTHIEAISNGMGSASMMLLVLAAEGQIPARLSLTGDTGSEMDCLWSTGERTTAREYFDRVIEPYAEEHAIEARIARARNADGSHIIPIIELMEQGSTAGVPLFGSRGGATRRRAHTSGRSEPFGRSFGGVVPHRAAWQSDLRWTR